MPVKPELVSVVDVSSEEGPSTEEVSDESELRVVVVLANIGVGVLCGRLDEEGSTRGVVSERLDEEGSTEGEESESEDVPALWLEPAPVVIEVVPDWGPGVVLPPWHELAGGALAIDQSFRAVTEYILPSIIETRIGRHPVGNWAGESTKVA